MLLINVDNDPDVTLEDNDTQPQTIIEHLDMIRPEKDMPFPGRDSPPAPHNYSPFTILHGGWRGYPPLDPPPPTPSRRTSLRIEPDDWCATIPLPPSPHPSNHHPFIRPLTPHYLTLSLNATAQPDFLHPEEVQQRAEGVALPHGLGRAVVGEYLVRANHVAPVIAVAVIPIVPVIVGLGLLRNWLLMLLLE